MNWQLVLIPTSIEDASIHDLPALGVHPSGSVRCWDASRATPSCVAKSWLACGMETVIGSDSW